MTHYDIKEVGTWGEFFLYPTPEDDVRAAMQTCLPGRDIAEGDLWERCCRDYRRVLARTIPRPYYIVDDTIWLRLPAGAPEPPAPPGYPTTPEGFLDLPTLIERECPAWGYVREWLSRNGGGHIGT